MKSDVVIRKNGDGGGGRKGEFLVLAAAPTNTTQFLMGEHGSANNSPDSDWERFHSETEFETREFAKEFYVNDQNSVGANNRARLVKNELISEYLVKEKSVQMLEKQVEAKWGSHFAAAADLSGRCSQRLASSPQPSVKGLADQIRRIKEEIEELTRENQELAAENRQLRTENGRFGRRKESGSTSSSSSDDSSSSEESSSSSSSSSCSDSSSEDEEEEEEESHVAVLAETAAGSCDAVIQSAVGSCEGEEDTRGSSSSAAGGDDRRDDTGYESDRSSSISSGGTVTSSTLCS
jgi:regulator of replication initiation timing